MMVSPELEDCLVLDNMFHPTTSRTIFHQPFSSPLPTEVRVSFCYFLSRNNGYHKIVVTLTWVTVRVKILCFLLEPFCGHNCIVKEEFQPVIHMDHQTSKTNILEVVVNCYSMQEFTSWFAKIFASISDFVKTPPPHNVFLVKYISNNIKPFSNFGNRTLLRISSILIIEGLSQDFQEIDLTYQEY